MPSFSNSVRKAERGTIVAAAIAIAIALALAGPAAAQADQRLGGSVLDSTVTPNGADFARRLAAAWHEQDALERYLITVYEQPAGRRGSMIWIAWNGQRVFQAALPSNPARLANLVLEAGPAAYRQVLDAEVRQLLFRDDDLAPAEF